MCVCMSVCVYECVKDGDRTREEGTQSLYFGRAQERERERARARRREREEREQEREGWGLMGER